MTPAGFEPTVPASERPQTHALDHAATEIGETVLTRDENVFVDLKSSTHSQQVSRLFIFTWSHSDTHHSR
jgi:hypothetical protein